MPSISDTAAEPLHSQKQILHQKSHYNKIQKDAGNNIQQRKRRDLKTQPKNKTEKIELVKCQQNYCIHSPVLRSLIVSDL